MHQRSGVAQRHGLPPRAACEARAARTNAARNKADKPRDRGADGRDECAPSRTLCYVTRPMARRFVAVALAVLAVSSCRRCGGSPVAPDAGTGDVVARIGERTLSRSEVQARLERLPDFVRLRYSSPAQKREFVDALVRDELLVQEARRRGLESDPEIRSMLERLLIQKLTDSVAPKAPGDEAVRAYFDAHTDEFSRPERLHVALVLLESPQGDPKRAAVRAEAEKSVASLRALKPTQRTAAFAAWARSRSDHQASRSADGDLGLRTTGDLVALFGAAVAEAASRLEPDALSDALETDRGVVVLRVAGRQPASTQTFEAVRARIASRLTADARARGLDALVEKLRKDTPVIVDDREVLNLRNDAPVGPMLDPP